jgi:hypothetical protein
MHATTAIPVPATDAVLVINSLMIATHSQPRSSANSTRPPRTSGSRAGTHALAAAQRSDRNLVIGGLS